MELVLNNNESNVRSYAAVPLVRLVFSFIGILNLKYGEKHQF